MAEVEVVREEYPRPNALVVITPHAQGKEPIEDVTMDDYMLQQRGKRVQQTHIMLLTSSNQEKGKA